MRDLIIPKSLGKFGNDLSGEKIVRISVCLEEKI